MLAICPPLSSKTLPPPFYSLFCDVGAGTLYAVFPVSLLAGFRLGSANERHWWETGRWEEGRGGPFPASVPVNFTAETAKGSYDSTFQLFLEIPGAALQGLTCLSEILSHCSLWIQSCTPKTNLVSAGPQLP